MQTETEQNDNGNGNSGGKNTGNFHLWQHLYQTNNQDLQRYKLKKSLGKF